MSGRGGPGGRGGRGGRAADGHPRGEVVFEGELWVHDGEGGWHFVTLPPDAADDVRELAPEGAGFGSRPVTATIGGTTWRTSVFPETRTGSFVLPVKQPVRRAEDLLPGDRVTVRLAVG